IRVFTDEEIKRLHEACLPPASGLRPDVRRMLAARNRAVLWVLLDTGMRESELYGMRFMDFDRRRGTIYIMGQARRSARSCSGSVGITTCAPTWTTGAVNPRTPRSGCCSPTTAARSPLRRCDSSSGG